MHFVISFSFSFSIIASETDHDRDPDPEIKKTRKSSKNKRQGGEAGGQTEEIYYSLGHSDRAEGNFFNFDLVLRERLPDR